MFTISETNPQILKRNLKLKNKIEKSHNSYLSAALYGNDKIILLICICCVYTFASGCASRGHIETSGNASGKLFPVYSPQRAAVWDDTLDSGYPLDSIPVKTKTTGKSPHGDNELTAIAEYEPDGALIYRVRVPSEEYEKILWKIWFDNKDRVIRQQFGGFEKECGCKPGTFSKRDICTIIHYFYDSSGYLIKVEEDRYCDNQWDRKAEFFYDDKNRLITKQISRSTSNDEVLKVEYKYDSTNRIIESLIPFERKVIRSYSGKFVTEEVVDLVLNKTVSKNLYTFESGRIVAHETIPADK